MTDVSFDHIFKGVKGRTGRPRGARDAAPRAIRRDAMVVSRNLGAQYARGHEFDWLANMRAAKALLPTCERILRSGVRCGQPQLRGHTFCRHHLPDDQMAELDHIRHQEAQIVIDRCASPSVVYRALRRQVAIEIRQLKRIWRSGEWRHPGETLHLHAGDAETVRRRLLEDGVDIASGEFTPYTIDRCRWLAFQILRGSLKYNVYSVRLSRVLRSEEKWRQKHGPESSTDPFAGT